MSIERRSFILGALAGLGLAAVPLSKEKAPAPPPAEPDGWSWGGATSTPLEDIREARRIMEAGTGQRPTQLVMSESAWRQLRDVCKVSRAEVSDATGGARIYVLPA